MLLEPGDAVVVEDAVYPGTLAIMAPYRPNYITVDSDGQGMKPDKLREALKRYNLFAVVVSIYHRMT